MMRNIPIQQIAINNFAPGDATPEQPAQTLMVTPSYHRGDKNRLVRSVIRLSFVRPMLKLKWSFQKSCTLPTTNHP
jgi:hypothetical protein